MIALDSRQTDRQVKCRALKVKQDLAFARSNNVLSWRALDQGKENRRVTSPDVTSDDSARCVEEEALYGNLQEFS